MVIGIEYTLSLLGVLSVLENAYRDFFVGLIELFVADSYFDLFLGFRLNECILKHGC